MYVFPVTCSTDVSVKCKATLQTLVRFPYFTPTCLCKEPKIAPECNQFRDLVFDHPCLKADQTGESVMNV